MPRGLATAGWGVLQHHVHAYRGHMGPRVRIEVQTARDFGSDVVFGHELPDGRYRWLVGDVTGHTLASALVTITAACAASAAARSAASSRAKVAAARAPARRAWLTEPKFRDL